MSEPEFPCRVCGQTGDVYWLGSHAHGRWQFPVMLPLKAFAFLWRLERAARRRLVAR